MSLETSHTITPEKYGKCERCTFITKLTKTPTHIGNFFGKPVYDDGWLCDLCMETIELEGDKLLLYLVNLILSRRIDG